jgi:hypothetical protein
MARALPADEGRSKSQISSTKLQTSAKFEDPKFKTRGIRLSRCRHTAALLVSSAPDITASPPFWSFGFGILNLFVIWDLVLWISHRGFGALAAVFGVAGSENGPCVLS